MASHNLIITYDLKRPGQNYLSLFAAIRQLGKAVKFQYSAWYVASDHDPQSAAKHLWQHMDNNDALFVVDAVTNVASWYGLSDAHSASIQRYWVQTQSLYRRAV